MNTMISGSSGALTVFLMNYFINITTQSRFSLIMLCNGNLAGLVAITAYISYNYIVDVITLKVGLHSWSESWEGSCTSLWTGYSINLKLMIQLMPYPYIWYPFIGIEGMWNLGSECSLLVRYGSWDPVWTWRQTIRTPIARDARVCAMVGYMCVYIYIRSGVLHTLILGVISACKMLRNDNQIETEGIDFAIGSGGSYKYQPVA